MQTAVWKMLYTLSAGLKKFPVCIINMLALLGDEFKRCESDCLFPGTWRDTAQAQWEEAFKWHKYRQRWKASLSHPWRKRKKEKTYPNQRGENICFSEWLLDWGSVIAWLIHEPGFTHFSKAVEYVFSLIRSTLCSADNEFVCHVTGHELYMLKWM